MNLLQAGGKHLFNGWESPDELTLAWGWISDKEGGCTVLVVKNREGKMLGHIRLESLEKIGLQQVPE